jgi:cation transport regulator ChaB
MPRDRGRDEEVPSTIQRSDARARRIWKETHDAAVKEYGEGERAHRTAFASLKHNYEKVGDHWEPKRRRGPSDSRASKRGSAARRGAGTPHEGVDANASKAHLRDVANRLQIRGRSTMSKQELVKAIEKANHRETARARAS